MAATLTISIQQYEALIALARAGTVQDGQVNAEKAVQLDEFLKSIEKANGITRSGLWVRWTEMDQPLPPTTRFPASWPPSQQYYIELVTRLVARADVDQVLQAHARRPLDVMVTKDPGALVGWTQLDSFFVTG